MCEIQILLIQFDINILLQSYKLKKILILSSRLYRLYKIYVLFSKLFTWWMDVSQVN